MERITLGIEGMTCGGCARRVERALGALPGVGSVVVDLAGKRAVVTHDPARAPGARLEEAVSAAGYPARIE